MTFEDALAITLRAEGGYVNDPVDRGGATNYGVTQRTFDAYNLANNKPSAPVLSISMEEVEDIYRTRYWNAVGADSLEWPLSAVMFDMAVNHGPVSASKMLQKAMGVAADGQIGPISRTRIESLDADSLTNEVLWERVRFYRAISRGDQIKFLRGWLIRVEHLRAELGLPDNITPAAYAD